MIKKYVIYGNIWESMGIYADVYIHSHTLPSGTHTPSMKKHSLLSIYFRETAFRGEWLGFGCNFNPGRDCRLKSIMSTTIRYKYMILNNIHKWEKNYLLGKNYQSENRELIPLCLKIKQFHPILPQKTAFLERYFQGVF